VLRTRAPQDDGRRASSPAFFDRPREGRPPFSLSLKEGMERREAPGVCETPLSRPCDRAARAPDFGGGVAKPAPGARTTTAAGLRGPPPGCCASRRSIWPRVRDWRAGSTAVRGMSPRAPLDRRAFPASRRERTEGWSRPHIPI